MTIIRCALLATFLLVPTLPGVSPAADVDQYGDALPSWAVARLGGTRLRHAGVIQDITYSQDGKTLISASDSIRVWDATSGRLMREMAESPGAMIHSPSVSPDGRAVAMTGGRDGDTVPVLELATGRELIRLKGHKHFSTSVAFSPDGKVLATGGTDGTIRFWDLTTEKELRTLDNPGTTTYLAYTPGGSGMVSTSWTQSGRGECRLWDLGTGQVVRRWADVGKPTVLSPDGKMLAAGTTDPQLRLWDVDTGKELRRFELPGENRTTPAQAARCAALSPDSKLLAAGDMTNRVHVWDMSTGKELYVSLPFQNWVTCLAFSPDGKTLAVGAWRQIRLWEAATGKDLLPLGGHAYQVNGVHFSPDGKTVATRSEDALILWDPLTGRERRRTSQSRQFLGFAPDGSLLLAAKSSTLQWQTTTGENLHTLKVSEPELADDIAGLAIAFSPDGKTMTSGCYDRMVRLWNLETGEELWHAERTRKRRDFPGGSGHWPLGFTHDGKAVVSHADDRIVRIWHVNTGKELSWFPIESSHAVLSPDGRFLVAHGKEEYDPKFRSTTSYASPPRMWDLTTGQDPRPVELYPKDASSPVFSPDGSLVAVSPGPDIVLIERASGKVVRHLKGHRDHVIDLAFSSDGRLLVSGSYDLTGLVWDVTGLMRDHRFPNLRLTPAELEATWADLADADAAKAHQAIWKLSAAPKQAVPLLASRLKLVLPIDPDRIAKLIGDLDDPVFAVREKAAKELEKLTELAEPALRKALDQQPTEEVRSRLNKLIEQPPVWPESDPERLRALRAVSVLGQIGDTDARKVLDALAKGAPSARLTQEAKASSKRLTEHPKIPR